MKVTIRMSNEDEQVVNRMDGAEVLAMLDDFENGDSPVLVLSLGSSGDMCHFARRHIVSIFVEPDVDATS